MPTGRTAAARSTRPPARLGDFSDYGDTGRHAAVTATTISPRRASPTLAALNFSAPRQLYAGASGGTLNLSKARARTVVAVSGTQAMQPRPGQR